MHPAVLSARSLSRQFTVKGAEAPVVAVRDVSLEVPAGALTALVGPDGAGKTTLLRMAAGLLAPSAGSLSVLDIDVAAQPQAVQDRISYMPQRLGLYEDLSVQENMDLYADLHGVPADERRERFARLLHMTDLARFTARPAGKLSGGMKQKLGLACTLVRSPELLLLDEPTVGVDPLSRRELWEIVQQLVDEERLSVIVSTSYMDEAERCAQVFVMHEGSLLASGAPGALLARAEGLCFCVTPRVGESARALQARLIDAREVVVDAVPQGGHVRYIRRAEASDAAVAQLLGGLPATPVPARLEDGFMMLLRAAPGARSAAGAPPSPEPSPAAVPSPPDVRLPVPQHSPESGPGPTPSPPDLPPPVSAALQPAPAASGERSAAPSIAALPAQGDVAATVNVPSLHAPAWWPHWLKDALSRRAVPPAGADEAPARGGAMIEVRDLVRKFGDFTAVASTSFSVARGEIFGLLGPNGAGKTTTFRMLCGLLPATSGFLQVAGVNLRHARAQARARVGYVAQKFALYGNLTVAENLDFFGGAYGLHGKRLKQRTSQVLEEFQLRGQEHMPSGQLPGGFGQRLAMATGLLHEPEVLFLDEPTSGADPLARREFWRRITTLAGQGVTVVVTTHFMEEAEYCDRIVIQDAGKVLAIGTPREVREQAGGAGNMEDAFIAIVEQHRNGAAP